MKVHKCQIRPHKNLKLKLIHSHILKGVSKVVSILACHMGDQVLSSTIRGQNYNHKGSQASSAAVLNSGLEIGLKNILYMISVLLLFNFYSVLSQS